MKTVMIVEDEKLIRQGIASMVRNAPVEVEQVLECKDGLEALDCLQGREIDLVITDLKMPQMDGVELVTRMGELQRPPFVVVISGYDEFNYAVSMLRMGVRDYILKPVDRNRIFGILERMEAETRQRRLVEEIQKTTALEIIRSLLLGESPSPVAFQGVVGLFEGSIFSRSYGMACLRDADCPKVLPPQVLHIENLEGHTVLMISEGDLEVMQRSLLNHCCAGFSGIHHGFDSLREAYREAMGARRQAFVLGRTLQVGQSLPHRPPGPVGKEAERIVQLIGVGNAEEANRILQERLFLAQNNLAASESFPRVVVELRRRLLETYPMEEEDRELLDMLESPLGFLSAYQLYEKLSKWIKGFAEKYQNNEEIARKMHEAMEFLYENFTGRINMAVVSNHVSMNYSQFSTLFKRLTNKKFREYLRELRIQEGRRLLQETDLSIREVSEEAGFTNEKHFMKVFKETFAVSPSDYRRTCRANGPWEEREEQPV